MSYESPDENAMILPIPVRQPAREDNLRFIDLKEYPDFFRDLNRGFPFYGPSLNISCGAAHNLNWSPALKVFEVGNYIASFVPSLADFSRLADRFRLPESTWSQIPQYENYGFAVFQLAAGSLEPHPMAFEFDSSRDSIYFPTVHIHDGVIHETEEFDHVLYMQHAGFDSRVFGYENADIRDTSTGLVRSKYFARQFCDTDRSKGVVNPSLLVHHTVIRGNHPNQDTWIETQGDPTTPTLNLRPLLSYTPWLIFAGVVTWFFRRRAKLIRERNPAAASTQKPINLD